MGLIVLSVNNVPPKLRGFLTKYLWEINTGIYIGNINARIRKSIWERCTETLSYDGRAVMAFPMDNEQGFGIEVFGDGNRPVDFDGLQLVLKRARERDLALSSGKPEEYVVLDVEATGLDVKNDSIIEIGAIHVKDGEIIDSFQTFVKEQTVLEFTNMISITNEDIIQGRSVVDALNELSRFVSQLPVVGYNIYSYDMKIILAECQRNNIHFFLHKVIDAYELVRRKLGIRYYTMLEVATKLSIKYEEKHRALPACMACKEIFELCNGQV